MNISSAIVYVKNFDEALKDLAKIKGCEVHLEDRSKAVVIISIEAESVEEEIRILNQANSLPSVLEARLHYSYSEDELTKARENLLGGVSPLLDDSASIEELRYSGNIDQQMPK